MPGLFLAGLLAGCDTSSTPESGSLCQAETTPIHQVQGDGYYSPLEGTRQAVAGVVTLVDSERGFYIESPGAGPAGHSRGLYVSDPGLARRVEAGQRWVLVGQVEETGSGRDKMTTLDRTETAALCAEDVPLPQTSVRLPLDNPQRENLEAMRVAFDKPLFVTDVHNRFRGGMALSAGAPLHAPTEVAYPGGASADRARRNRNRSISIAYEDQRATPLAVGSEVHGLAGVLGHDGRRQVLLARAEREVPAALPEPLPAVESGQLRVVNINLLNFFNGNGRGGGFPTERGAESKAEFREQQARTRAALAALGPDLLAVQELENDGFGPFSAAASLLELLNDGADGSYDVVRSPGRRLGGDVITVGLLYRGDALEPVGPSHTLDSAPFRELSRQPLAQLFRDKRSGATFLVAVNHLKSKGGCPEDRDEANANHGQGCWNPARTAAVSALLPWLEGLSREAGTDHVLVLGDMNAYRMEDPVRRFKEGEYTELVEELSGLPQYSHRYFGQAGTLDYAFASQSLARHATRAVIWHINADWPRNMDLPRPWLRMSDHDPVIVDFDFGR